MLLPPLTLYVLLPQALDNDVGDTIRRMADPVEQERVLCRALSFSHPQNAL